jgi:hypothetical protein
VLGKAADETSRLTDNLDKLRATNSGRSLKDVLFDTDITELPGLFVDSLTPPWKWGDVAEAQKKPAEDAFRANLPDFLSILNNSFKQGGTTFLDLLGGTGQPTVGGLLGSGLDKAFDVAKTELTKAIGSEKTALDEAAAEAARAKLEQSFQKLTDNLQLAVDRAGLTKQLGDDLDALQDLKAGLQKQVKAGVDVASAQSALVTVVGQIADKQAEIRQKAFDALQGRQFRALGLSATGDEIVPGVENLRKQLDQLTTRLGAEDVNLPSKLASQLDGVRKVLSGKLGDATKETREKINELFKTIRETFDKGSKTGFHTATTALSARKLLEGLGLTPQQEAVFRQRVSRFNSAGVSNALPRGTPGAFGIPLPTATTGGPLVVQMQIDGATVAQQTVRDVTILQQKHRRSNPVQKRGPNRGI